MTPGRHSQDEQLTLTLQARTQAAQSVGVAQLALHPRAGCTPGGAR